MPRRGENDGEEDKGSSNVAIRHLLKLPGRMVEPEIHNRAPPVLEENDDPTDQKNQDWYCNCDKDARKEECKRSNYWAEVAKGRDVFTQWMASKHLEEATPEDYFPIYLLLKTKRHISRELLRDMFLNFHNEVHELALNPHNALKAACDHLKIPWNVTAYLEEKRQAREDEAARMEAEKMQQAGPSAAIKNEALKDEYEDKYDTDKDEDKYDVDEDEEEREHRRIIEHLIDVMCALMEHLFAYTSQVNSVCQILELLNNIYIDLLKVNNLSQNEYFFCFSTSWLFDEYLERYPIYRSLFYLPRELPNAYDNGEASVTDVVRTNDLLSIDVLLKERMEQKPPGEGVDMKPEDINNPTPGPSRPPPVPENGLDSTSGDSDSSGVKPKTAAYKRRKAQKKAELKALRKARLAEAREMWKVSYLDEIMESPPTAKDLDARLNSSCDCGLANCEECSASSCICGGPFCYVLCRNYSKFLYGDLLAKNAPHLYLSTDQDQAQLEQGVKLRNRRRTMVDIVLTEVKEERLEEALAAAAIREAEDAKVKAAAMARRARETAAMQKTPKQSRAGTGTRGRPQKSSRGKRGRKRHG